MTDPHAKVIPTSKEIAAKHQEFEGWCVTCMQGEEGDSVPWPCDTSILLATLAAVEVWSKKLRTSIIRQGTNILEWRALDRILKGGK